MGRNLVVCMDGTGNTIKPRGNTNVLRLYGMLENSRRQLTFYSPGVGTQSDPRALTPPMRRLSMLRGLITGHGMRRDLEAAYTFLVENWEPGDRIFIFGFSRGAFAALSVSGMTRLTGLLRPESTNMIGRSVRRYTSTVRDGQSVDKNLWRIAFAREASDGPEWWAPPIEFIGLFDTVRATKYFRFWTRLREDGWAADFHPANPYTHKPTRTVRRIRHAISLHDRRVPYDVFRIRPEFEESEGTDLREVWFAGVHSDVGGGFDAPDAGDAALAPSAGLGRITLKWMVEEAVAQGLVLRPDTYETLCNVSEIDMDIHSNGPLWLLVGLQWRYRRRQWRRRFLEQPISKWLSKPPEERLLVHDSVRHNPAWDPKPLELGRTFVYADSAWQESRPKGYTEDEPAQDVQPPLPRSQAATNLAVSMLGWLFAVASVAAIASAPTDWTLLWRLALTLLSGPFAVAYVPVGWSNWGLTIAVGAVTFFWLMLIATLVGIVVARPSQDSDPDDG